MKRLAVVAILLASSSGLSLAEDLMFKLDNQSSQVIDQFYASPVDTNDWEEDILGQDVLDAGASADVTIADGGDQCAYDLKFITQGGAELVEPGIDLCSTHSYTLTDE